MSPKGQYTTTREGQKLVQKKSYQAVINHNTNRRKMNDHGGLSRQRRTPQKIFNTSFVLFTINHLRADV